MSRHSNQIDPEGDAVESIPSLAAAEPLSVQENAFHGAEYPGGASDLAGGKARNRQLARGLASSLLGRVSILAAPLITIPIAYGYLGAERYGLWMAVTSLTSMALFADLGIGNGVLTKLAASHARGDLLESRRIVSSAYGLLAAVAFALCVGVVGLFKVIDWSGVFNLRDPEVSADAAFIVLVSFLAFAINIPISLIQRVQYAQKQIVQSNVWQAGGGVLSVGLVVMATEAHLEPRYVVAAAVFSLPLTNLLNNVVYFALQNRNLTPRVRTMDSGTTRSIVHLGAQFLIISVMTSLGLNSDTFIVSSLIDSYAAAHYSIAVRMFSILGLLITMIGLVLWPANSEAMARGDIRWVRRTARRVSIVSLGAVLIGGIPLVGLIDPIMSLWFRSKEVPEFSLPFLLALWIMAALIAVASPMFMVQNSVGFLRPQIVGWLIFLPVSLCGKVILASKMGAVGVPLAGLILYALVILPAAYWGYRTALSNVVLTPATESRQPRGDLVLSQDS